MSDRSIPLVQGQDLPARGEADHCTSIFASCLVLRLRDMQNIPSDSTTLKEELAKIRARNMERRAQREADARVAAVAEQARMEKKSSSSGWPWCE